MKKLYSFVLFAIVLSASAAMLAQHNHAAASASTATAGHSMTGVITDTMCGKTHMLPGKSDAECVKECVRSGSKYALLVGNKVYTLAGDSKKLEPFAGKKVKVAGEMKGDTMAVASIGESK